MIQNISTSADAFLVAVNRLQARTQHAQEEIGSGLRVNKPSDDPGVISDILQINATLSRNNQIGKNLDGVTTEVSAAELALTSAINALDAISTLGVQGASFNQSAEQRAQLAVQVQDQLQNLVGDAN